MMMYGSILFCTSDNLSVMFLPLFVLSFVTILPALPYPTLIFFNGLERLSFQPIFFKVFGQNKLERLSFQPIFVLSFSKCCGKIVIPTCLSLNMFQNGWTNSLSMPGTYFVTKYTTGINVANSHFDVG